MDNSALEWSTPRAGLYAAAAGGTVLAVLAVVATHDPAGTLLVGLAAAGLLLVSLSRLLRGPRLVLHPATAKTAAAIDVRGLFGTTTYHPDDIAKAQLLSFRRWGRTLNHLEIDLHSGQLLIFGRWDIGTHPQDVLDALTVHGLS